MPRNISFALTTEQFRNQTKTVTRRKGWKFLKRGDVLNACVKCMGLKTGEKIERLGQIRVVDVRFECLERMCFDRTYGRKESRKEGFPNLRGHEFALMFCRHMGGTMDQQVTRIEFEYIGDLRHAIRQDRLNVDTGGETADRGNREDNQPDSV